MESFLIILIFLTPNSNKHLGIIKSLQIIWLQAFLLFREKIIQKKRTVENENRAKCLIGIKLAIQNDFYE